MRETAYKVPWWNSVERHMKRTSIYQGANEVLLITILMTSLMK